MECVGASGSAWVKGLSLSILSPRTGPLSSVTFLPFRCHVKALYAALENEFTQQMRKTPLHQTMTSELAPVEQASHEQTFGRCLPKAPAFRIAGRPGGPCKEQRNTGGGFYRTEKDLIPSSRERKGGEGCLHEKNVSSVDLRNDASQQPGWLAGLAVWLPTDHFFYKHVGVEGRPVT